MAAVCPIGLDVFPRLMEEEVAKASRFGEGP